MVTPDSGKFAFSARFSDKSVSAPYIDAARLSRALNELPVFPALTSGLTRHLVRDSIFSSASLEGNATTEDRVHELLLPGASKASLKKAEKEILNLKAAYEFAGSMTITKPGEAFELTGAMVKEIHSLICGAVKYRNNQPGKYRDHQLTVGDEQSGGPYIAPATGRDVSMLMGELCRWINSVEVTSLTPRIRAALAHFHILLIHPFSVASGRTARLVEAVMLKASGVRYVPLMLSGYYGRKKDEYFNVLSTAIKNENCDVTAFIEFVMKGHVESLTGVMAALSGSVRTLSLRQYCEDLKKDRRITKRQADLLALLSERAEEFELTDLFKRTPYKNIYTPKVTEAAAIKDLQNLLDEGFLTLTEDGKYEFRR